MRYEINEDSTFRCTRFNADLFYVNGVAVLMMNICVHPCSLWSSHVTFRFIKYLVRYIFRWPPVPLKKFLSKVFQSYTGRYIHSYINRIYLTNTCKSEIIMQQTMMHSISIPLFRVRFEKISSLPQSTFNSTQLDTFSRSIECSNLER